MQPAIVVVLHYSDHFYSMHHLSTRIITREKHVINYHPFHKPADKSVSDHGNLSATQALAAPVYGV